MRPHFLALILCLFGVLAVSAQAETSVSATLSSAQAEVGEAVNLQIAISGSGDVEQPQVPDVAGLSISYAGQSSQFQINNFQMSSSLVYTFSLVADHAGDFTIPALTVKAGGNSYKTQPLTLHVASAASAAQGDPNSAGQDAKADAWFATIQLPKATAYVGEALPAEIKVFVDARIRSELQELPALKIDGFTTSPLKPTARGTTDRNGRTYNVIVFKTALTPVKAGELSAGPCDFSTIMQIPQSQPQRRARSGSPLDRFFNDPDFPDPFGMGNFVARQVKFSAPAVTLQVKPLPTAGQPANFSGAVGLFRLGSQASASEGKAGEPITLTLAVSGHGDFDRVKAPQLPVTPGWRAYPATGTFKADDDVGISGTKNFSIALVPEAGQTQLPPLDFSYFDPEQEKYLTLHTVRMPVAIHGTATSTPTPALVAVPKPSPAAAAQDIHYILSDPRWDRLAWTPWQNARWFWTAQAVPLAALLAFIGLHVARTRGRNEAEEQARQLTRQLAQSEAEWRKAESARGAFIEAAATWMDARAAQLGQAREEMLGHPALSENTRGTLREISDLQGELRYAGTANRTDPWPPERRARYIAALEELRNIA